MATFRGDKQAFGFPGIAPRWTNGAKDGVGTAYSASSRVWFTLWRGILTEAFFPSVDRPQMRDCQYLITDEASFLYEEKRHLQAKVERLPDSLGYTVHSQAPDGSFVLAKTIISDPHLPSILMNTHIVAEEDTLARLKFYLLCAPHLGGGGAGNNGYVVEVSGRQILVAEKDGIWMAISATVPFSKLSCGFVGSSDGWTDLVENYQMDNEFDRAINGNIALTGELDLQGHAEHTVALSFGSSLHHATTSLLQSLSVPFPEQLQRFAEQWRRTCKHLHPYEKVTGDGGKLYRTSCQTLLAHEDKENSGAIIASLSIPWGEANGDEDLGGYHLVWPRDMVNSASALLAAGNVDTALRGLVFLATCQRADGGFAQNFWIDGTPYWNGVQMDEVAFPIILAWRLHHANALHSFDPYTMVMRAAKFMILHGPTTGQDRWEEASGFSPSTLAVNIAAAVCAANWALYKHDQVTADFLFDYADYLESHVDRWTTTTTSELVPGISRHYVRINTASPEKPHLTADESMVSLANQRPGAQTLYRCKDIVDAGFLELVRFGIRRADDPLIVDSLAVVDKLLKVDTPYGPCWRRYNHDGYGQKEDGTAYTGYGIGRAWPLLTGERGHYELAAGRSAMPYIQAMEQFAAPAGPIPEQVWDSADIPSQHMFLGKPTGAAMPLAWAHGEYIKLVRSASDGVLFDTLPEVRLRYQPPVPKRKQIEIWRKNWQIKTAPVGSILQIHVDQPFVLSWTMTDWQQSERLTATHTGLAVWFTQLKLPDESGAVVSFTLFYTDTQAWEGHNYSIEVSAD